MYAHVYYDAVEYIVMREIVVRSNVVPLSYNNIYCLENIMT